jgi:hypothetical protein
MSTLCVEPKKAMVGVHAKVVVKGEARVVPSAGVRVAPMGTPMAVMVRLPVGVVPVTLTEKGDPTGATKVPVLIVVDPTTQVGDGRLEISTIMSRGEVLVTPARVEERMSGTTKRCPLVARVRSQVSRHPPDAAITVGIAPPEGTEGMAGEKPASVLEAKRQFTGSKSGSKMG